MKTSYFLLCITFLIISCSPTFKVKPLDQKTGKLPTDTRLETGEILTEKNVDVNRYKQFLFISKNGPTTNKFETYITETIREIGGFNKIYTQPELEQFVIQNNLTDKVTSISDRIGLLNLQKQVGDYLICVMNIEFLGGYEFRFEFKIVDPSTWNVLLDIKHKAFNWSGLDRPLFNPVFNYYIDWLSRNKK